MTTDAVRSTTHASASRTAAAARRQGVAPGPGSSGSDSLRPDSPRPDSPAPAAAAAALREALECLERASAGISRETAEIWSQDERMQVMVLADAISRKVAVVRGPVLLAHERDGTWQLAGDRDFAAWRGRTTRTGRGAAQGELAAAEAMARTPKMAEQVAGGRASLEHAKTLGDLRRGASAAVRKALDAGGEAELARLATHLPPEQFRARTRRWAAGIDAAAAQRDHDAAREHRSLTFRRHGGGVRMEGFFDPIAGELIRTAVEAVTSRPGVGDDRTTEQRRADALTALCDRTLGAGEHKIGAQVRPHLSVIVPSDTWARMRRRGKRATAGQTFGGRTAGGQTLEGSAADGAPDGGDTCTVDDALGALRALDALDGMAPAQLLDGQSVAPSELERLMCDCALTRTVMDADSILLDVGREQRTFAGGLRRAILVRDRHCMWPGCTLRASYCEVHHIRPFENGGETSADNALTLCSFHHHKVHRGGVHIESIAGGVAFHRRDGTLIGRTVRESLAGHELRPAPRGPTMGDGAGDGTGDGTGGDRSPPSDAPPPAGNSVPAHG